MAAQVAARLVPAAQAAQAGVVADTELAVAAVVEA
jgi:hypothetical protein